MVGHALRGYEEVGDGGCEVEKTAGTEGLHELRDGAEHEEVVVDGCEWEGKEQVLLFCCIVFAQDADHLLAVSFVRYYASIRTFAQEIQETVCRMAVMPRVWQKTVLTVEEYDGIAGLEKVLGGCCATSSSTEVVDESHGVFLQGNGRSARRDKDEFPAFDCSMLFYELLRQPGISFERLRSKIFIEVVSLGVSSLGVEGHGEGSVGFVKAKLRAGSLKKVGWSFTAKDDSESLRSLSCLVAHIVGATGEMIVRYVISAKELGADGGVAHSKRSTDERGDGVS